MKNLIKYEFRKTWMAKLIILGIAAFAELAFLITLYLNKEGMNAATIVALTFLAMGGVMYIGIQSVVTMHQDMNTKQGYMLYMTPNSCYRILGGKVIENGISMFLAGAFFFALGVLDVTLLFGHHGELNRLWSMVQDLLRSLQLETKVDLSFFLAAAVAMLCAWLSTVVTAYLADVISTCVLYGKRFNGWLSFLLFILLTWGFSALEQACTRHLAVVPMLYATAAIAVACTALMYWVTAFLMDRHLSV